MMAVCWEHIIQMKSLNDSPVQGEVDPELNQLIGLTTQLLSDLIDQQGVQCESIFNSSIANSITIPDFLHRVHRFTQFSKQCLVIAIIYLDRYNMEDQDFSLNATNVHKILLTCLLLATKYQDDRYYDNKAFQFAGGVNVAQLHRYQLQIFNMLDYNLYVNQQSYYQLRHKLNDVYGQESTDS